MSENHEKVFAAKTAHLETYGQRFKEYWRREMEQRERLARDKEDSEYNRIMLQRIGKEIQLDVRGRRQVAKEDYLMATQTQLENFDVFVNDTQNRVSDQVKTFVRDLEVLKRKHNEQMLADQDKAIGQLRKFFQGVNVANSSIIHQLKNEVNDRRSRLDRIERDVLKALEENAKYLIPLQQMNSDVVMYEEIVKQAPAVQAAHRRLWARSKHLEEQVLRLTWNKELAAKSELKELQTSYTDATFDIARKASLAQVLYRQQQVVMEEELAMYTISRFLLQAYSSAADAIPPSSISRQTSIRDFLERQEEEIAQLRIQGLLIKRKYEMNREKMDKIFTKKYMHGLSGVGLKIAPLETYLDNDMVYFHGESEEKLRDMEGQPAIARWSSTIAHAGPSGDHSA
ncbi:hypothetical protein RvY_17989 [Ramazzottius varieornatus]|uniref:Growth arrest-specific protein 8 domain-containing protein n=1 Tax=Ramazzottius varieornatus TaxID=947166 RepID=A0A1D1W611_RAMVA|nr:hypothetical protein RvY_17989 [Ramazzottius varieornatus]